MFSKAVYNKDKTISHYEYIDGEIVQIMAKHLNFTPVYIKADENYKHGYQLPNGTFTGSLAAAEYWQADLIANHRVKMEYNTSASGFLDPILLGKFYYIIPNPPTTKEILFSMLKSFDFWTKFLFLVLLIIFPIALYFIYKIENRIRGLKTNENLSGSALATVAIISSLSAREPIFTASRITFAMLLFYSIIATSLIHSLITQNLNTKIAQKDIQNLDQILDENYGLDVNPEFRIMFKNADGNRMARKLREISNSTKTDSRKPSAILLPESMMENYLHKYYDNTTKVGLYKKVPEMVFQAYESMMVPKRSPIQGALNEIIQGVTEFGIAKYQLGLAEIENEKIMIKRIKDGDVPTEDDVVIKLEDLKSVFIIYLILNFCAIVVFGLELLVHFVKTRRNTPSGSELNE